MITGDRELRADIILGRYSNLPTKFLNKGKMRASFPEGPQVV